MRLYYMAGSCALSCHIALEWAGAQYDLERLSHDDLGSDAFRAVNPKGKVPALRLEDGTVVTEALAVLFHIAEAHPEAALLPRPGGRRAAMLEALGELTGEFHPAFAPLHVPERFTTDPDGHDAVQSKARARVRDHYDRWAGHMKDRDWVLSDARSAADPYLYVMCRWAGMVEADLSDWQPLARFAARVEDMAGTRAALDAEGLDPISS